MKARLALVAACILIGLFASAPGFAEQQTYEVKKGDNLHKIGKLFNTTPDTLKKLNGLSSDRLDIGQILNVSVEQPTAAAQAVEASSAVSAANANNLEQRQIQQGKQTRKETQNYTVRRGDTVSRIAQSFNVSVKDITAANNLKNNNKLSIGQKLVIPGDNITPGATIIATAASKTQVIPSSANADEANNPGQPQAQQVQPVWNETQIATTVSPQTINTTDLKPPIIENEEEPNTRDRLVEAGFNLLGVRYRFGGTSEKTGLDCSALVKNLFEKFGFSLPRSSREQYKQGEKVSKEDLQKGDLVFFSSSGKTPTHVGIYIGGNQFLHAASRSKKVVISDLGKTWYDARYLGARRIVELWSDDAEMPLDDKQNEELAVSFQDDNAQHEEFAASVTPWENQ